MVQVITEDVKRTKYSMWLRWTLKAIYNKLMAQGKRLTQILDSADDNNST